MISSKSKRLTGLPKPGAGQQQQWPAKFRLNDEAREAYQGYEDKERKRVKLHLESS